MKRKRLFNPSNESSPEQETKRLWSLNAVADDESGSYESDTAFIEAMSYLDDSATATISEEMHTGEIPSVEKEDTNMSLLDHEMPGERDATQHKDGHRQDTSKALEDAGSGSQRQDLEDIGSNIVCFGTVSLI
jgi:hypothetical protein